jgi:hypothetical protein
MEKKKYAAPSKLPPRNSDLAKLPASLPAKFESPDAKTNLGLDEINEKSVNFKNDIKKSLNSRSKQSNKRANKDDGLNLQLNEDKLENTMLGENTIRKEKVYDEENESKELELVFLDMDEKLLNEFNELNIDSLVFYLIFSEI